MRAAIVVVILAGCDSLASSDYVGEPLFTLGGTFDATEHAGHRRRDRLDVARRERSGRSGRGRDGRSRRRSSSRRRFTSSSRCRRRTPRSSAFADGDVRSRRRTCSSSQTVGGRARSPRRGSRSRVVFASADVAAGTQRRRLSRRTDQRRLSPAPVRAGCHAAAPRSADDRSLRVERRRPRGVPGAPRLRSSRRSPTTIPLRIVVTPP